MRRITLEWFSFYPKWSSMKNCEHRIRRDCPIPGCQAKLLLRLSNHLHKVHNIQDGAKRNEWLDKAVRNVKYTHTTECAHACM